MSEEVIDRQGLARLIDHSVLEPEATREDVEAAVALGRDLGVYAVCVSPSQLPLDTQGLVLVSVCAFPSGAHPSVIKAQEASWCVEHGAQEIDMVMNLGAALDGQWDAVRADIAQVREAVPSAVLKVIIESAILDDAGIVHACESALAAGADFVKTSTGFHSAGGASVHAVELMSETVGNRAGVKASGGIRTTQDALNMVRAGATRLGLSRSESILAGVN